MDYESFTRDRIARLRAEVETLERNLKEYLAMSARASSQGAGRKGRSQEGSAIGVVMEAIEAAGPEGLTIDQMIALAADRGFDIKRPTLRSQLWAAKNDDKVVQLEPGRYASKLSRDLARDFAGVRIEPPGEGDFGYSSGGRKSGPRETFTADPDPFAPPDDDDDEIPF